MTATSATSIHYDQLLGPRYAWMTGDFPVLLAQARSELSIAGISLEAHGRAIDVGAGRGQHALALAQSGWQVTALEACPPLIAELQTHADNLQLKTSPLDWRAALDSPPNIKTWDAVLCLGDTLCHLADTDEVDDFLTTAAARLSPGGRLVLTFRDYSDPAATGQVRVIPVKSDEHRILTCVLHFGPTHVAVHDLFHEKNAAGSWTLHPGRYAKVRLAPGHIHDRLTALGLTTTRFTPPNGMIGLTALRLT